jgi:hypothetical protein
MQGMQVDVQQQLHLALTKRAHMQAAVGQDDLFISAPCHAASFDKIMLIDQHCKEAYPPGGKGASLRTSRINDCSLVEAVRAE